VDSERRQADLAQEAAIKLRNDTIAQTISTLEKR
jgi:hypothetical protein